MNHMIYLYCEFTFTVLDTLQVEIEYMLSAEVSSCTEILVFDTS